MPKSIPITTQEFLYDAYWFLGKSSILISKELGVSKRTVINYMEKFNIPTRSKIENTTGSRNVNYGKKGELSHLFGIKRSLETRQKMSQNAAQHRPEVREKSSKSKMGEKNPMYGIENKWGSHTEESKRLISSKVPKGADHCRYKEPQDRIEKINSQIRNCQNSKEWKFSVLKRDGFKCVLCSSSKNLEVDHIVPFAKLKKLYCVGTLEEAVIYPEFWDIDNGRTLCRKCHWNTDTWGQKTNIL